MPRCIIRITPNYKFNAISTSPDQQWEYNTSSTAKYFYESTDPTSLTIYQSNVRYNGKSFHFDTIYDSILSQYDFYSMEVRDFIAFVVNGVLHGAADVPQNNSLNMSRGGNAPAQKDVCVLLMGDQSSGERFVLHGPPEHPGLIYRSLKDVFVMLDQKNEFEMMRGNGNGSTSTVSVSCYYIDPNTDTLIDAFDASVNQNQKRKRQNIRLRDHPKRGIVVDGVSKIPIDTPESGINLLNQVTQQNASQFQNAHVIVSINVETTHSGTSHSLSTSGGASKKSTSTSSISFFSLNSPHDNKGGILPRNKQPDWVKQLKNCLDGLQNRTPSIAFHKSKPTSLLRDLLLGNRAGVVIHALSPNIESYKQMLWNMNLCQKLVDVSPKTKPQLTSPIQFRQAPGDMSEFMDENERHNGPPSPVAQTMRMNHHLSHDQGSFSLPASGQYSNPNWSHNGDDADSSNRSTHTGDSSIIEGTSHLSTKFLRRSSMHQQGSVPQSFMARSAQGGSSVISSGSKTPQRSHPLQRNQSKLSISTSFSQNTFQDPSIISSPTSVTQQSVSTNNFLSAHDSDLVNKYKKESASLKSELEILKRLKLTHQRKITQLEEKLDEFRNQHQDAIRSMKSYAKKNGGVGEKGGGANGSFSQKDFDMYREVMEQAITRMKETQSKLETQNDALKRHITKKDQELRKKDKDLIKLTRTQEEMQVMMEQVELEKSQLEKKLKTAEKRIASLSEKGSGTAPAANGGAQSVPEGFALIKSDKIQKYEEYIKETVEFNEKLRQEVLRQAETIEKYRKRYGSNPAGASNMQEEEEDSEESLKKQLHLVKTALADALRQLAIAKQ